MTDEFTTPAKTGNWFKNVLLPIVVVIITLAVTAAVIYIPFYDQKLAETKFVPFMKSEKLEKISTTHFSGGGKGHIFRDTLDSGYSYEIVIPSSIASSERGGFRGYVEIKCGETFSLYINPAQEMRYEISVPQEESIVITWDGMDAVQSTMRYYMTGTVDKNGNPIGRAPFNQNFMEWYWEHEDDVMAMFKTVHEVFGDALR